MLLKSSLKYLVLINSHSDRKYRNVSDDFTICVQNYNGWPIKAVYKFHYVSSKGITYPGALDITFHSFDS